MKTNKKLSVVCLACIIVLAFICALTLAACKRNEETTTDVSTHINVNDYISKISAEYRATAAKENIDKTEELDIKQAEQLGLTDYVSDGYQIQYSKHSTSQSYDGMLALGSMDNSWYPGAILKLSYREDIDNKFVSTNLKRKPITISASLETVSGISPENLSTTIEHPENLSDSRMAVSRIINSIYSSDETPDMPIRMSCSVVEVTKEEDLNIAVGLNTGFCGFGLSTSFSSNNSSDRTRAVLVLKQIYFTIDPDKPDKISDAFDGVSDERILNEFSDGTLPVYCSVVYGRIALVTIETDMSINELKASVNAHYGSFVELGTSLETLYRQKNTSMNFFIYGGTSEMEGALCVSSVNEFIEYLKKSNAGAPLPIGYRFYYTDSGVLAKIATNTEFYTQKMVPIKVEDFSINMRKTGTTISKTNSVVAGDVLCCDLEVQPSKARAYEISYSINKCKDDEGNFFALIDSETGRLRILDNAVIGESIKVTATLTQNINEKIITLQRDKIFRVDSIPVSSIFIEPANQSTEIIRGGSALINTVVAPTNASLKGNLNWVVLSGPAFFENPKKGLLKLRYNAKNGDKVTVCAVSDDSVASNELTFTVVAKPNEVLTGLLLTTESNKVYQTAGSKLNLSVKPVPQDYYLDVKKVTYEIVEGYEFAHIKKDVLYISDNAKGNARIVLRASCGEILSNKITVTILTQPILTNDNFGVFIKFPFDNRISFINITILDKDGICLSKQKIKSGISFDVLNYVNSYNGYITVISEINTVDENVCSFEIKTHSLYAEGAGTKGDPYKINSVRHFKNISRNNVANFVLTDDIEIVGKDSWKGLSEFKGNLNGCNKRLKFNSDVKVNFATGVDKQFGLIADNNYGTIANMVIDSADFKSADFYHNGTFFIAMGGVAGINKTGAVIKNVTIKDSEFTCDRNNSAFGFICGVNEGTVENCEVVDSNSYSTGDTGGIAGRLNSGVITGCTFAGQISLFLANNNGGQDLRSWGGVSGYVYGNNSVIKNCIVEACKFYYKGENPIYHRRVLWWHNYCNLQIKVGIIAGTVVKNSTTISNCNFIASACPLSLNLVGGNFHNGSHEKKYLFANLNGRVGCYN